MHPTRTQILDLAPKVFADHGFAGASTRTLADACDVNIGTLAYHFGNKQGVYEAVLDQIYAVITQHLAIEPEGKTASDRIRNLAAKLYRMGVKNRDSIRVLLRHVMTQGELPEHVQSKWSPRILISATELLGKIGLSDDPVYRMALLSINHLIARYAVSEPKDIQPFTDGDPIEATALHIGEVAVKLLKLP